MITISSDLGRPPSGSQLMKRKKLTSGVLKQPKMPENIPVSNYVMNKYKNTFNICCIF